MDASADFKEGTLLIVWNADSGWQNAVLHSLHKWTSPQTYSCKLCQLTYGMVGPRQTWKAFLESLDREVLFFHRDTLETAGLGASHPERFPFIMEYRIGAWDVLLSPADLDQIDTLESLIVILQQRLGGVSSEFHKRR